ncbi:MAG: replicative DNA helicase [Candidatus Vogelbacteria bacterium]|nr:replicative DNA helicase [Candidatus Vogelbacteria bacterium]
MATEAPFVKPVIRVPPQDLTAEQALLGSIMIKPSGLNELITIIAPDDFYSERHRRIYRAMLKLFDKNQPIDLVSLTSALTEAKQLEAVGGSGYLVELVNAVPSASNLKYYGEIVRKKAQLRRLIDSAERLSELGYREEEELDSIFEKAEKTIFGLANFSKKTFTAIKDTLADAWERFERLHKSGEGIRGLPTGFKELDNRLSGLQRSDLVILAARPSMGKTSLALDIARQVAKRNVPVCVFSLEMSSQQLVDRLIAAESHVDSWKLRTGRLTADDEFARIRDALDILAKAPIFIDDDASNNITKMKSVARRLKSEHDLGLVIVDYLQLMVPRRESDSLVQQVTEISRSLKALARELDIPVLALSQLNRQVEQRGGRPRLADLRDSGAIEQDADVVMFIHREDKYNEDSDKKNIAEIMIEKHRNGPTGSVELYFDDKRVCFTSIEKGDFGGF